MTARLRVNLPAKGTPTHQLVYHTDGSVQYMELAMGRVLWATGWASDWTHMVAFECIGPDGQPHQMLLSYKTHDGTVCWDEITTRSSSEKHREKWRPGWFSFAVHYDGLQPVLVSDRLGETHRDNLYMSGYSRRP